MVFLVDTIVLPLRFQIIQLLSPCLKFSIEVSALSRMFGFKKKRNDLLYVYEYTLAVFRHKKRASYPFTDCCKSMCGSWELNSETLEE